jgi:hypothetical protein
LIAVLILQSNYALRKKCAKTLNKFLASYVFSGIAGGFNGCLANGASF